MVELKEYWDKVTDFTKRHFGYLDDPENCVYYSNALAGETGEVCNATKKLVGGGTNPNKDFLSVDKVLYELIDVFNYLVLTFEVLNQSQVDSWDRFDFLFHRKLEELERRMIQSSKESVKK